MLNKKKLIVDYQQKFGDEQGARILADLERRCQMFRHGIDTSKGIDPNKILVLEGEANILKYIYRMMKRNPNEVVQSTALNITSDVESGE